MIKKKILLLALCLFFLPYVSAVTMSNQTIMRESGTNTAYIQVEQDTIMTRLEVNETYGGIIINDLQTFNSTYTNLNTTSTSRIKFELMDDVTVFYGNGTTYSLTGTNFDLEINIPANSYIILQSDVPEEEPSRVLYIEPNFEDTVPHMIIGRRLIFETWIHLNKLFLS